MDLGASQGIAICEYPLKKGHGFADYLLYFDGATVGVIEAKKAGLPLTAVEIQTAKYSEGLPDHIPAPRRPLPASSRTVLLKKLRLLELISKRFVQMSNRV